MIASLFTEWYGPISIPQVKEHQKSLEKEDEKVLLIVDNVPTHLIGELLGRTNGQFTAVSLPQTPLQKASFKATFGRGRRRSRCVG